MLSFAKEMYPKIALLKAAYFFSDRAYIHLDANDKYYLVNLSVKPGCSEISENEFVNEMLCQCVRHEVYEQTKSIRELLTARAMASTMIEQPGVFLQTPAPGLAYDEKEILTDWFEAHGNSETE